MHFVFKPIIQHHLDSFRQGWARHRLRTEQNRTPQQLWISGLYNSGELDPDNPAIVGLNVSCNHSIITLFVCLLLIAVQVNWDTFGIDLEGPVPLDDDNTVTVEELEDILSDTQKQHLKGLLAPLSGS